MLLIVQNVAKCAKRSKVNYSCLIVNSTSTNTSIVLVNGYVLVFCPQVPFFSGLNHCYHAKFADQITQPALKTRPRAWIPCLLNFKPPTGHFLYCSHTRVQVTGHYLYCSRTTVQPMPVGLVFMSWPMVGHKVYTPIQANLIQPALIKVKFWI